MNLREIAVQSICSSEEARFQALMQAHHYVGVAPDYHAHALVYRRLARQIAGTGEFFSASLEVGGP